MGYGSRYQKKQKAYALYAVLLAVFLILGYLVSGICKLPDVSIFNLEESLFYVFRHPFSCWNEKTPAFLGAGFILWFLITGYILYYYRNFHSEMEHGDADWLDAEKAAAELKDKDERYNRILSEHVSVSLRGGLSNNNMLVIGSSGSFKTTSLVHQNLLQHTGSYVMLDVKGDTQYKFGNAMLAQGYKIYSLNFKNPEISDRYNPFLYIEREDDLLRVIKALHDACRPKKEASMADPFWDDAVDLYLLSTFAGAWLDGRENGRTATMNDVLHLINLEAQKETDPETEEEISLLQKWMDKKAEKYGADYPPVRDYRKLKEGAPDTVRSVLLMVNSMLSICETAEVKRIFSGNEIDIRRIGQEKSMLFLCMPDNNDVYTWIISMFYTQMFDILIRLSDDELHAPLPVPVEVWMDEFYAGAKPADPDKLLGVVRSRNISMIPILQSIAQIETLFPNNKWEVIMDNVSAVVYLGSGPLASATHKYISEALGETTIDKMTDNLHRGSHGNAGLNFDKIGVKLMTPDQVKRMPPTECIIFLESRPPIYDTKAIPFDKPQLDFRADVYLKRRYKEALALGAYRHPVYTVYDPVHFSYVTVNRGLPLQIVENEKDIRTLQEAAKNNPDIYVYTVDEKDLLYLSWGSPQRSPEEVERLYKRSMEKAEKQSRAMQGLAILQDADVPESGTQKKAAWDARASFRELLVRHWDELSAPEQEEICFALDDGLTDEQLKKLLLMPLEQMPVMRRAFVLENQRQE